MINRTIFSVIFVFIFTTMAHPQEKKWSVGFTIGSLQTIMDGKDRNDIENIGFDNSARFSFGLRVQHFLKPHFAITAIPSFAQSDFRASFGRIVEPSPFPVFEDVTFFDVALNYLHLPVMATWVLGKNLDKNKGWNLSAGLYTAFLLTKDTSGFLRESSEPFAPVTQVFLTDIKDFDTGLQYEFRRLQPIFGIPFSFDLGTTFGFLNLDKNDRLPGINNRFLYLGISVMF